MYFCYVLKLNTPTCLSAVGPLRAYSAFGKHQPFCIQRFSLSEKSLYGKKIDLLPVFKNSLFTRSRCSRVTVYFLFFIPFVSSFLSSFVLFAPALYPSTFIMQDAVWSYPRVLSGVLASERKRRTRKKSPSRHEDERVTLSFALFGYFSVL